MLPNHLLENDEFAEKKLIAEKQGRGAQAEGQLINANPFPFPARWQEHCSWNTGFLVAALEAKFSCRLEVLSPPPALSELKFEHEYKPENPTAI